MNTILRIPILDRYNSADHLAFHEQSIKICDRNADIINAPGLLETYHFVIEQEQHVFKWTRRSEFTAKKADADHARDSTLSGIAAIVKTDMKHFDPSIRDNAVHVYNLLVAYGNIPKADYDAETANIDSLITRLMGDDYFPAVQNLNLVEWVNELHEQNELFKSYVDDVAQEKLVKPDITPAAARRNTDAALRQITNRVSSLVILNGQADYAAFIAEFNVIADHFNNVVHEHYGRLHARIDITPAAIDSIPEQPCTGKPVFVIPGLTLAVEKEGKQTILHPVFSEDFTVAYKNNIEPGTATLVIKGMGKYTGEITTTFNIVHV
ncbi:MAG: DUF6261 family protein [Dysgonamonadaceae bacterium]|jgi:hypothetical protein|nr:DUF6261 family protein [Dysgonamonadaceae bacterium]